MNSMPHLLRWRTAWTRPTIIATLAVALAMPADAQTATITVARWVQAARWRLVASHGPDVVPTSLSIWNGTVTSGATTPLQIIVTNKGASTAYAVTVTISLSTGGTISRISRISMGTLKSGATGTITTTFSAPTQPGTYDVIATATAQRDTNSTNTSITTTL